MKRAALASLLIFSACVAFTPDRAVAQADDFNDGNDTGWVRYDPLGTVGLGPMATYSFPNGGYRIQPRRHPAIPASESIAMRGATGRHVGPKRTSVISGAATITTAIIGNVTSAI